MAERDYFSIRYAIPGFTFILVLLATNYVPLIEIIKNAGIDSAFGAFLGFASLFTGSALGFLISQPWYIWYEIKGSVLSTPEMKEIPVELEKAFKLKEGALSENRKNLARIDVILDYVLNKYEKDTAVWRYIQRRIDMYHTLSCTVISLLSGLALGLSARIYYESYLFAGNIFLSFANPSRLLGAEFFAELFICLSFLILAIFIGIRGRKNPLNNYRDMLIAVIRGLEEEEKEKLHTLFLQLFPKSN